MSDDDTRIFDPVSEFCSLYHHSTVVVDGQLYILQGYATYIRNGTRKSGTNPHLRIIDLNQDITVASSGEFIRVETNSTAYPETLPQTVNSALWWNVNSGTLILAMGGTVNLQGRILRQPELYNPGLVGQMWTSRFTYTSIEEDYNRFNQWKPENLLLEGQTGMIASKNTYFDVQNQKGYIVGGSVRIGSANVGTPTDSFITYDAVQNVWTNSTLPWGRSHGNSAMGTIRINGRLVHIHVGGYVDGSYVPMNEARIYDSETGEWYTQAIRGPVPEPRGDPCTAVVAASDQSSYQILMFGGSMDDSRNSQYLSELWALNIPSFTWVRLDNSRGENAPGQRSAASCNIVKNHILVVYGGKKSALASYPSTCEEGGNAAYFMDLNTLTWLDTYEGTKTESNYSVPGPVYAVIGGNGYGGANLTAPTGGFESEVLGTIFAINGTRIVNPNSSQSSSAGPESTSGAPDARTRAASTPIGAIVGGVLAAIALLALGILAFIWFRRKKRSTRYMKDLKGIGLSDEIPIGGRSELPILSEALNYQQHLAAYKNYRPGSHQNVVLVTQQAGERYVYELPTERYNNVPFHTELESPLERTDSQRSSSAAPLMDPPELPLPPMPPAPPQPQN